MSEILGPHLFLHDDGGRRFYGHRDGRGDCHIHQGKHVSVAPRGGRLCLSDPRRSCRCLKRGLEPTLVGRHGLVDAGWLTCDGRCARQTEKYLAAGGGVLGKNMRTALGKYRGDPT